MKRINGYNLLKKSVLRIISITLCCLIFSIHAETVKFDLRPQRLGSSSPVIPAISTKVSANGVLSPLVSNNGVNVVNNGKSTNTVSNVDSAITNLYCESIIEEGVLRQCQLDAGITKGSLLSVGDTLSLILFDNVEINLEIVEKMRSPLGGRVFLASVVGYDGIKNAVVVQTDKGLQIDIQDFKHSKVYTIFSNDKGVLIREINPKTNMISSDDTLTPNLPTSHKPLLQSTSLVANTNTKSVFLDILVAFDRNATKWANSYGGGITNFAIIAVQKMNTCLANTGLDTSFKFRLVGVMSVDAEGDNLNNTLNAATEGEGNWAAIKAKRDEVGADLVSVLIDTGSAYGTTGLSWMLATSYIANFSENAYSTCLIRAVAQSYVMLHECGHNLGAGHSDTQVTQPGPQLFNYSAGYYFTANGEKYHTIMAYDSDGNDKYTEIPYFSSPNYKYQGVVVGDTTHDNTCTLLQVYSSASQWRTEKIPNFGEITFNYENKTTFDTSLSITLSCDSDLDNVEIRYTLDGSEPNANSTLYTKAFTITASTTVKACAVLNGKLGMVYQATYYKKDLSYALNTPDINWTASTEVTWNYETTKTADGVMSIQAIIPKGKTASIQTTVVGPKYINFSYDISGSPMFYVYCDSTELYFEAWSSISAHDLKQMYLEIPSGEHTLKLQVTSINESYCESSSCVVFDKFLFSDVQPPTFDPTVTSSSSVCVFTNKTFVTITHPDSNAKFYYTLDGLDPNDEGAIVYEGPFPITNSVTVRAIATVLGGGNSPVSEITYSEQHSLKAGEWTTDVDAAFSQAAKDGNLIAILADANCGYADEVIYSDKFLAWSALNGVYLVSADTVRYADAENANEKFWQLYGNTTMCKNLGNYVYYPTFIFILPSSPNTCVGTLYAWSGQTDSNGNVYNNTVDGLLKTFASMMGKTILSNPSVVISGAGGIYPRTVTVTNPNSMGIVYYTLDGSLPSLNNGTKYTGLITITSPCTLKVAVCSSSSSFTSSSIVIENLLSIDNILGSPGLEWQNDAVLPWVQNSFYNNRLKCTREFATDEQLQVSPLTSTLKTSVVGPGKLTFDYGISSGYGKGELALKVNNEVVKTFSSTYVNSDYVYNLTATGETTIVWTYTYPKNEYNDEYYSAYLANLKWEPVVLFAPKNIQASQGDTTNAVYLTWYAVTDATSYRVYRSTDELGTDSVLVRETEKVFAWDDNAEPGVFYYYTITAVKNEIEGIRSNPVKAWCYGTLKIKTENLKDACTNVLYTCQLTAQGGEKPYTWQAINEAVIYNEERSKTSTFSAVGTAKGWRADDKAWLLSLPFNFPFYGKKYSEVYVSSNGTLSFGSSFYSGSENINRLMKNPIIAVLWDNLTTARNSTLNVGDIYVYSNSQYVTIRWSGRYFNSSSYVVNFSVTLYPDGTVRMSYGTGNIMGGMIGMSAGDNLHYILSSASQSGTMQNAKDIIFSPVKFTNGLSLSSSGLLSGTPLNLGTYPFTVIVTDAIGTAVTNSFELKVTDIPPGPTLEIDGESTAGMTINDAIKLAADKGKSITVIGDITDNITLVSGADIEVNGSVSGVMEFIPGAKMVVNGNVSGTISVFAPSSTGSKRYNITQWMKGIDKVAKSGVVTLNPQLDAKKVEADATLNQVISSTDLTTFSTSSVGSKTDFTLSNAKPGLYYALGVANDLNVITTATQQAEKVQATETGVTLPITRPTGNSVFFMLRVTDQ